LLSLNHSSPELINGRLIHFSLGLINVLLRLRHCSLASTNVSPRLKRYSLALISAILSSLASINAIPFSLA